MKLHQSRNLFLAAAIGILSINSLLAQPMMTESGSRAATPRDGIYDRSLPTDKRILAYDYVNERDVFWEKRVWQSINLRERRNQYLGYTKAPLIKAFLDHAMQGDITLYSTFDDEFKIALDQREIHELMSSSDTITIYDPVTLEEKTEVVYSEFDYKTVTQYRVKEVWFFDNNTSRLKVRILGIAPVRDVYDDNGNFIATMPMFWVYYPDARQFLAQHEIYNEANDASRLSMEDAFEMRLFSANIIKESNVFDRRIQDYKSGIDILYEGDAIRESIRNFEGDLWEY